MTRDRLLLFITLPCRYSDDANSKCRYQLHEQHTLECSPHPYALPLVLLLRSEDAFSHRPVYTTTSST